MNNDIKKYTIKTDSAPVSWERQRFEINRQIDGISSSRKRFVLIHRWVDVAALIIICLVAGLFIIRHSITSLSEPVSVDENFTLYDAESDEYLPDSLVVLNEIDSENESFEKLINFVVPQQGGMYEK